MKPFLLKLPFLVILMGIGAVAMLVPMAHAVRIGDFFTARIFLQSGLLFLVLCGLIAVASVNFTPRNSARSHLIALLGAYVLLPVMLAYPLTFLVTDTGFFTLYFEMLSSLTTTGATLFDDPARLSEPVHLWRAFVGWLGGLLVLVSAIAIMAPLNLGGFEVYEGGPSTGKAHDLARIRAADMSQRLVRYTLKLAPVYLSITLVLAFGLLVSGERAFVALVHAMSTLSTSGISVTDGLGGDGAGLAGEVLVFFFLLFAVSRATFSFENGIPGFRSLAVDHEFRLMLGVVTILPLLLFLRHWIGAIEIDAQEDIASALSALWGGAFMVLSFLTTTGFESTHWHDAQNWSGLRTPGLLLIGMAVMGGGVATTAGGVKLLRVYALYKHGTREIQRLAFPSSVGGAGRAARFIRREGAYLAWLFFMLFAISTAVTLLALTLTGLDMEVALAFAVSALSTTGPLAGAALEGATDYGDLGTPARLILSAAMVLGRLETLAIVALLNPDFWRS